MIRSKFYRKLDFLGLISFPEHEALMKGKPTHCQTCSYRRSTSIKISIFDLFKRGYCADKLCACYKCRPDKPFCTVYCGGNLKR